MVASTMAYSMSGSSEQASKSRMKTSALTQSRYRLKTVFHLPKKAGRSRHGLLVRTIQSTASTKRRLSLPLRPGSLGLPRQCGSIFAHWASVSTNRSIQSLNHNQASGGILNLEGSVRSRGRTCPEDGSGECDLIEAGLNEAAGGLAL